MVVRAARWVAQIYSEMVYHKRGIILSTRIESYRITRFEYPRSRVVGDSQVRSEWNYYATLELTSSSGQVGLGFFGALFQPLPPLAELNRVFEREIAPSVIGQNPFSLANRVTRPRGGNIGRSIFAEAINQACWDLQGKELNMPLYQVLGGTKNRVPAYASGLDYHLTTDEVCNFFAAAAIKGFSAFKIKVGHPDRNWDIARLRAIWDAVGEEAIFMVDANEAWSPKEAIRRLHAYHDAGFTNILWIEDPILRDDFEGLALVAQEVPFMHINSGEYLDAHGKRQLMEHRAVDMLNIHGNITETMRAGWLASELGIPVTLGNTFCELGVHMACALPEALWLEYSFLDWNVLVEEPIVFENGYAIAPDRPGHGLTVSESARREYARTEPRA